MATQEIQTHRPWAVLLEELCRARNESYRQASLAAGLDHGAVHRFVSWWFLISLVTWALVVRRFLT